MNSTRVLDTTVSDVGPINTVPNVFLRSSKPLRFSCDLGAGDVLIVYSRSDERDDWNVLHTFDADNAGEIDIYLSSQFKVERETDGGAGDSEVFIADPFYLNFSEHEA